MMNQYNPDTNFQRFLMVCQCGPNYLSRLATRALRKSLHERVQRDFDEKISELKAGDICIDLGANVGVFTRKMAEAGAVVYAFEPDPETFEKLKENVGDLSNVVLYQQAVGAKNDRVLLRRAKSTRNGSMDPALGSSVVFDSKRMAEKNTVEVNQISFRKLMLEIHGVVKLIKMDIEGAEFEILEDFVANQFQPSNFEAMFVETHEWQEPKYNRRLVSLRNKISRLERPIINLYWH
jgi:FkbM family methyltransferase